MSIPKSKPRVPCKMITKNISELEGYEISYLLSIAAGNSCVIRDWNGIYCFEVVQHPVFTFTDENDTQWVIDSELDITGMIDKTSKLCSSFEKNILLAERTIDGFNVKISVLNNVVSASAKTLSMAYALALLKNHYGNDPKLNVDVPVPFKGHSCPSGIIMPYEKKVGITLNEFYA